jgi:hypothetical protein
MRARRAASSEGPGPLPGRAQGPRGAPRAPRRRPGPGAAPGLGRGRAPRARAAMRPPRPRTHMRIAAALGPVRRTAIFSRSATSWPWPEQDSRFIVVKPCGARARMRAGAAGVGARAWEGGRAPAPRAAARRGAARRGGGGTAARDARSGARGPGRPRRARGSARCQRRRGAPRGAGAAAPAPAAGRRPPQSRAPRHQSPPGRPHLGIRGLQDVHETLDVLLALVELGEAPAHRHPVAHAHGLQDLSRRGRNGGAHELGRVRKHVRGARLAARARQAPRQQQQPDEEHQVRQGHAARAGRPALRRHRARGAGSAPQPCAGIMAARGKERLENAVRLPRFAVWRGAGRGAASALGCCAGTCRSGVRRVPRPPGRPPIAPTHAPLSRKAIGTTASPHRARPPDHARPWWRHHGVPLQLWRASGLLGWVCAPGYAAWGQPAPPRAPAARGAGAYWQRASAARPAPRACARAAGPLGPGAAAERPCPSPARARARARARRRLLLRRREHAGLRLRCRQQR